MHTTGEMEIEDNGKVIYVYDSDHKSSGQIADFYQYPWMAPGEARANAERFVQACKGYVTGNDHEVWREYAKAALQGVSSCPSTTSSLVCTEWAEHAATLMLEAEKRRWEATNEQA